MDKRLTAGSVKVHADVVFPKHRTVVFVDGCFWHRCPIHGTDPKSNTSYWLPKLAANVERDQRVNSALAAAGWRVIRIWEHEDPIAAAEHVAAEISKIQGGLAAI